MDIDLRTIPSVLYKNGVVEESGVSINILNHPAKAIAWLANKLAPYDVTLAVGEMILVGSFTSAVVANSGDTFHIEYGPLGSIACHFV